MNNRAKGNLHEKKVADFLKAQRYASNVGASVRGRWVVLRKHHHVPRFSVGVCPQTDRVRGVHLD